jgi:hypothetical protein
MGCETVETSQTGFEEDGALVGEVVETVDEWADAPRQGSLAWLELQEHVTVNGRELPSSHRIPDGSTWRSDEERGTRCALVKPGGVACGAPATKRYGVCLVHCGGGSDPREMTAKAAQANTRLRIKRELLGIGPRSSGNPRAIARLAVAERAADVADALLAPLDDRKLGTLDRQRAATVILGETFPLASATIEVDLPASAEDVGALGWADLQALAARVLDEPRSLPDPTA